MKRFHVHVSVPDLAQAIGFYSTLFGQQPAVTQPDYAKWMLEDPRVNFAISTRGAAVGIDHVGLQVDSDAELEALHAQLERADAGLVAQSEAACCYARSNKYWVQDPAGIAWETFHTLESIPVYGEDRAGAVRDVADVSPRGSRDASQGACCAGAPPRDALAAAATATAATVAGTGAKARCCG